MNHIHMLQVSNKVQDKFPRSVKSGEKHCDALEWGWNDCIKSNFALDKHKWKPDALLDVTPARCSSNTIILKH